MQVKNQNSSNDVMFKFLTSQDTANLGKAKYVNFDTAKKEDSFEKKSSVKPSEIEITDKFSKDKNPEKAVADTEMEIKNEKTSAELKDDKKVPTEANSASPEEAQVSDETSAAENEEVKEAAEITEAAAQEQVNKDEQSDDSKTEGNVTKKQNFIDKLKDFFKNLFIKLMPKKETNTEKPSVGSSAGGNN